MRYRILAGLDKASRLEMFLFVFVLFCFVFFFLRLAWHLRENLRVRLVTQYVGPTGSTCDYVRLLASPFG